MQHCARDAVGGRGARFCAARMQGDVLADLSQADLEEAYLQAGVSFQASKWCLDELRHQVSCDTRRQGTEVSKQLPGSCSKASVQQLSLTNL